MDMKYIPQVRSDFQLPLRAASFSKYTAKSPGKGLRSVLWAYDHMIDVPNRQRSFSQLLFGV